MGDREHHNRIAATTAATEDSRSPESAYDVNWLLPD
jgi:hypothetical protein